MRFKLIIVSKIRWKKTTQLLILALSTHAKATLNLCTDAELQVGEFSMKPQPSTKTLASTLTFNMEV